jgi:DNA-binding IclR family transcriptional regulator
MEAPLSVETDGRPIPAGPVKLPGRGSAVPSVEKAVAILNLLAAEASSMSLAKIAKSSGLPKSTTFALCCSLLNTRMVVRREDGTYEVGPHVVELARAYMAQTDLPQAFVRACAETKILPLETLVLAVLDGTDVVYLAQRRGERPLGITYEIGLRLPAHCTASGKSLLSSQPPEVVRRTYAGRGALTPLTEHSVHTVDDLLEQLIIVRAQGFALDREETAVGMVCVGAPIIAAGAEPVGAVAVSLVEARITDDAMLASVVEDIKTLAGAISVMLGGRHPASA